MLIVCPSCATSYDVEPARLEPDGRQVRCVRCRTVWVAAPSRAAQLLAAAEALAPAGPGELAEAPAFSEQAPAMAAADPVDESAWSDQAAEPEPGPAGEGETAAPALADNAAADASDTPDVEAPPIAPVDLDAGRPPIDVDVAGRLEAAGPDAKDVESYAARLSPRRDGKRRRRWSLTPLTRLQTAILALIIIDAVIVGWRRDIVRMLPQTASFYSLLGLPVNLRGLVFDDVTTSTEQHDGVPILVVQGTIVNRTSAVTDVPRMKLQVRNAARQEIYAWTAAPPRATLTAYQAVAFRTRLASPPPEAADVLVRFFTRHDLVADPR
jgi:predicted Zn finger-like uncharacterized protein